MSSENAIEVSGESVEEAIAKGLAELQVEPFQVIVEVLEEPSTGMMGLETRPARVRLQLLGGAAPPTPPPPAPAPAAAPNPPRHEKHRQAQVVEPERFRPDDADYEEDEDEYIYLDEDDAAVDENDLDEEAIVGRVVLGELLERMSIHASIVVRRAQSTSGDEDTVPWILDVQDGDLSVLIGRRGETLASLQYITRLVTSREIQNRTNIIVDVNGYKLKRAKMLRGLAERMAEQAAHQQRTITLEPMPPHERRIVHLTLRNHPDVSTRSVGEGNGRKVTIVPKTSE